jgi:hypothetical protein
VLEAEALDRVVELDVHAQVVGVELQLVAGDQATLLVHVHGEGGKRAVGGKSPMTVPVRGSLEFDVRHAVILYEPLRIRQGFVEY